MMDWNYRLAIIELYWMEKQQAEFADNPMLKFSTYSAGLRQGCFLKVSEPEVHRCGEFALRHNRVKWATRAEPDTTKQIAPTSFKQKVIMLIRQFQTEWNSFKQDPKKTAAIFLKGSNPRPFGLESSIEPLRSPSLIIF